MEVSARHPPRSSQQLIDQSPCGGRSTMARENMEKHMRLRTYTRARHIPRYRRVYTVIFICISLSGRENKQPDPQFGPGTIKLQPGNPKLTVKSNARRRHLVDPALADGSEQTQLDPYDTKPTHLCCHLTPLTCPPFPHCPLVNPGSGERRCFSFVPRQVAPTDGFCKAESSFYPWIRSKVCIYTVRLCLDVSS
ncbi:uncharacterized protein LOC134738938 [Pongo pygmaeus]|uniref:uncharacterized protein LOC134738938 n=1 Tax=Pongo pygmaeus TaxID=9600 RepID=UPI00300C5C5D